MGEFLVKGLVTFSAKAIALPHAPCSQVYRCWAFMCVRCGDGNMARREPTPMRQQRRDRERDEGRGEHFATTRGPAGRERAVGRVRADSSRGTVAFSHLAQLSHAAKPRSQATQPSHEVHSPFSSPPSSTTPSPAWCAGTSVDGLSQRVQRPLAQERDGSYRRE